MTLCPTYLLWQIVTVRTTKGFVWSLVCSCHDADQYSNNSIVAVSFPVSLDMFQWHCQPGRAWEKHLSSQILLFFLPSTWRLSVETMQTNIAKKWYCHSASCVGYFREVCFLSVCLKSFAGRGRCIHELVKKPTQLPECCCFNHLDKIFSGKLCCLLLIALATYVTQNMLLLIALATYVASKYAVISTACSLHDKKWGGVTHATLIAS